MCGSGRCGTWRALQHENVTPDIMPTAKGLAGGYLPLGATVYRRQIGEIIEAAYGGLLTGHTFTGHTASCAAGVAVQKIVEREGLVERVARLGETFKSMLQTALGDIGEIGDIRGRGFFVGIELVQNAVTKEPFPAEDQLFLKIRRNAFERGLICYPSGGNVDGKSGDTVILAPPYIAGEDHLAQIAATLAVSVKAALMEIRQA
jgi:adenosylmethionine-8-amino-7-oxononanoate aminotransferase